MSLILSNIIKISHSMVLGTVLDKKRTIRYCLVLFDTNSTNIRENQCKLVHENSVSSM
jgi:hypothetical protein